MRKKTLAGVCSLLAFGLVFGLGFVGIRVPFGLSPFVVFLILVPLLMVPLAFLNRYLLAWRKTRGRDIEEEENYEIGSSDFISLRPKSERPADVTEKNSHLPILFR
jgi:hypothetical protein